MCCLSVINMDHDNHDGNNNTDDIDPVKKGSWEPIKYHFRYLPIHIALLRTGKVLAFGGSGNDETRLNSPYPAEIFEPCYKDRTDGENHHNNSGHNNNNSVYEISNTGIVGDIFCCGHAFLPDGRLIVAGGTYKYDGSILKIPIPPFSGLDHSYIFDPIDLKWSM